MNSLHSRFRNDDASLRAATSLARLWQRQGKRDAARDQS